MRGCAVTTHYSFSCSARRAAASISDWGVPVWTYVFNYEQDFLESGLLGGLCLPMCCVCCRLTPCAGDYHMSELFFVFGNQWLHTFSENDLKMSAIMQKYWTNFATYRTCVYGDAASFLAVGVRAGRMVRRWR